MLARIEFRFGTACRLMESETEAIRRTNRKTHKLDLTRSRVLDNRLDDRRRVVRVVGADDDCRREREHGGPNRRGLHDC
jgi:hypothetical protein